MIITPHRKPLKNTPLQPGKISQSALHPSPGVILAGRLRVKMRRDVASRMDHRLRPIMPARCALRGPGDAVPLCASESPSARHEAPAGEFSSNKTI